MFKKNRPSTIFNERGISSLAEITLVMGILVVLFMIGLVSFPRIQQSSSVSTILDAFLADFKQQQIKAMTGDTEGSASSDNYGIHFDTTKYTLFKGAWSAANPSNFIVNLPNPIQVTTACDYFGEKMILFEKGTGKIASWNSICTITFIDTGSNIQKTIQVEELGTFTLN